MSLSTGYWYLLKLGDLLYITQKKKSSGIKSGDLVHIRQHYISKRGSLKLVIMLEVLNMVDFI